VYFTKKKYFHRLGSDSARNNIHRNNKQKPEITNENTRKITCQYVASHSEHGVRAGKFLKVQRIFAQTSTNLPEKYSQENDLKK